MLWKSKKLWFARGNYFGLSYWVPVFSVQAMVLRSLGIYTFFGTWEDVLALEKSERKSRTTQKFAGQLNIIDRETKIPSRGSSDVVLKVPRI